jgi:hypothetical protein
MRFLNLLQSKLMITSSIATSIAAWSAIAGVAATAIGTGVSYKASQNAAATNEQFALMNAQAASQGASQQGAMQAAQAQLEAIKQGKAQEAAYANAAGIRAQTERESGNAQENIRRSREDFARMLAQQRAATASRGIVDTTGSPLELLVKGAETQALAEEEMRYADEISRRQGFRSADLETIRGETSGIDVGMSLLSAAAARNNAAMGVSQAKLGLFGARAQSAGMRSEAMGSLISGIGGMARDAYSYRRSASTTYKGAKDTTAIRNLSDTSY